MRDAAYCDDELPVALVHQALDTIHAHGPPSVDPRVRIVVLLAYLKAKL